MTGYVQERRSRQTGTIVAIFDRGIEAPSITDPEPQRWETICVDHGTVCSHTTRALAERFAPTPLEWCEDCREAHDA